MLNKKIWFGILVMTLVLGMAAVEVEAQSGRGGEFTLTNIPAKYDGKYVIGEASDEDGDMEVQACDNVETEKPSRIKDGKVILPLWIEKSNGKIERYSGNHTLEVYLEIWDEEGLTLEDVCFTVYKSGWIKVDNRVNFSNGSAAKSYNDRDKN